MNKQTIEAWLEQSNPGDRATYHTGLLTADRQADFELHRAAWAALRLAENNVVHLLQRRVGKLTFDYMMEAK